MYFRLVNMKISIYLLHQPTMIIKKSLYSYISFQINFFLLKINLVFYIYIENVIKEKVRKRIKKINKPDKNFHYIRETRPGKENTSPQIKIDSAQTSNILSNLQN